MLPGTTTAAYFAKTAVTKEKSFISLAPRVNDIMLFTLSLVQWLNKLECLYLWGQEPTLRVGHSGRFLFVWQYKNSLKKETNTAAYFSTASATEKKFYNIETWLAENDSLTLQGAGLTLQGPGLSICLTNGYG